MQILGVDHSVKVSELAEQLDVSDMTIRRDAQILASQGLARVYHGAVVLNPSDEHGTRPGYVLSDAETTHMAEKNRIGRRAAAFIEEHESVIIDGGSTPEALVRYIPENTTLTVTCVSLNAFVLLGSHRNIRRSLAGGLYHPESGMFEGPEVLDLLHRTRAHKAFVSASGVHPRFGVTCSHQFETEVKRAAIQSSITRILLVDSSKFDVVTADYFADLWEFHIVVTDDGLSRSLHERMLEAGLQVELV
jgi:DeoR family deoxyribose operon repressor